MLELYWICKSFAIAYFFSVKANPDSRLVLYPFITSPSPTHTELYYLDFHGIFHSSKYLHIECIEKRSHIHYILWNFSIIFFYISLICSVHKLFWIWIFVFCSQPVLLQNLSFFLSKDHRLSISHHFLHRKKITKFDKQNDQLSQRDTKASWITECLQGQCIVHQAHIIYKNSYGSNSFQSKAP